MKEKRWKWIFLLTSCLFLIGCIILGAMQISHDQTKKENEHRYMGHLYVNLYDLANVWEHFPVDSNPVVGAYLVQDALLDIETNLEDGYRYVSKDVPATVTWYFVDMASKINPDTFVLEDGTLSPEGRNFYTQLSQDMTRLCAPLVGEDQLNFNYNLSMVAFKDIFLDYYNEYEAKRVDSAG